MRNSIVLGIAALAFFHQEKDLPNPVRAAYEDFVKALETGKPEEIKAAMLAGAVEVTTDARKGAGEYGTDINLLFLKKGFAKKIQVFREEKDGTYIIRTGSSYLRFVETTKGWRLYRYGDKPIE